MNATQNKKPSLEIYRNSLQNLYHSTPLWILLLPLVFMLVLYGLGQTGLAPYLTKDVAEVAALTILSIATLINLVIISGNRHSFYIWQLLLALVLLAREMHFQGTNNGFYIGFVLLVWWALRYYERLKPFIQNRLLIGIFMTMIWTYFVSKTFDRHYWDDYIPPGATVDLFEENLELIGHLLFLSMTVITARMKNSLQPGN